MVKVTHVVETPNPDALKFLVDHRLVGAGARAFDAPAAAKDDVLARSLFDLGPISSVFYMDRFVTVTKPPHMNWEELQPKVVEAIEAHAKPADEPAAATASIPGAPGPDDTLTKIHQIIEENILPALAGDGGGLEILDFQDNVLTVHYQGACGSCSSATSGTLIAIQNLLQRMIDPAIRVVSA